VTCPGPAAGSNDSDHILVPRHELEHEHRLLLARLHRVRALLGYPPLITGKQQRKAEQAQR
jgi:pyruvate/oxaloacetate carboxyltransferase